MNTIQSFGTRMNVGAMRARSVVRTATRMAPLMALLIGLGVMTMAPLVSTITRLSISRQREHRADPTGAELLGDPEPLAGALENLQRGVDVVPMQVNPSAPPMYIVNPLSALHGKGISILFSTHTPMEERVRRLRALAPMSAPAYAEAHA